MKRHSTRWLAGVVCILAVCYFVPLPNPEYERFAERVKQNIDSYRSITETCESEKPTLEGKVAVVTNMTAYEDFGGWKLDDSLDGYLSDELKAVSISEIDTVIMLTHQPFERGEYSDGDVKVQVRTRLKLIDVEAGCILVSKELLGPEPPSNKSKNAAVPWQPPHKQIEQFLDEVLAD